jgi:L-lactate dehydrogenase
VLILEQLEIISRKKATYFAVGLAINKIVETILRNENSILTVSSLFEGQYGIQDVYLAIPTMVNRGGAKEVIEIPLSDVEEEKLRNSAEILKGHLDKCGI